MSCRKWKRRRRLVRPYIDYEIKKRGLTWSVPLWVKVAGVFVPKWRRGWEKRKEAEYRKWRRKVEKMAAHRVIGRSK